VGGGVALPCAGLAAYLCEAEDDARTCDSSYAAVVLYRLLADGVVVLHAAFVLFIALGGIFAWRWPWLLWLHVPAVIWGVGIVLVGYACPLTPLEKWLRRRGGEGEYEGGFIDRYVEDVVYPEEYTPALRTLAAVLIAVGWMGVWRRRAEARDVGLTDSSDGATR
jgi:hypothetical protein